MKKLVPYIISYLIIAAGTETYSHFARHARNTRPYFTVYTQLSHDELVAKLQQAGIPESAVHLTTVTPAPVASLVYHFGFYAVILGAFLGLAYLFQRVISK